MNMALSIFWFWVVGGNPGYVIDVFNIDDRSEMAHFLLDVGRDTNSTIIPYIAIAVLFLALYIYIVKKRSDEYPLSPSFKGWFLAYYIQKVTTVLLIIAFNGPDLHSFT